MGFRWFFRVEGVVYDEFFDVKILFLLLKIVYGLIIIFEKYNNLNNFDVVGWFEIKFGVIFVEFELCFVCRFEVLWS